VKFPTGGDVRSVEFNEAERCVLVRDPDMRVDDTHRMRWTWCKSGTDSIVWMGEGVRDTYALDAVVSARTT